MAMHKAWKATATTPEQPQPKNFTLQFTTQQQGMTCNFILSIYVFHSPIHLIFTFAFSFFIFIVYVHVYFHFYF